MVLIAISTACGFATLALIIIINRRQIRRLRHRLDTQAEAMILLARFIRDGDVPEGSAIPPSKPARHLHIVRDTAAIAALALLLRRTGHAAREHPTLTAVTVAVAGAAVTAALLTLPGATRQPGIALPTATGLSSYTAPGGPGPTATPPPSPPTTPPGATGSRTLPVHTTTPQPSGIPPLPATPPSTPPSGTGASNTGTPQPGPTAPYPPGPSPTYTKPSTTPTTTSPVRSSPPSSTPTTPSPPPPGPPPCVLVLDIDNLIELRLCGY